jgi:hypothetical protein
LLRRYGLTHQAFLWPPSDELVAWVTPLRISLFSLTAPIPPPACFSSYATVTGGFMNRASGRFATVVGGSRNTAGGRYSFAGGFNTSAFADAALRLPSCPLFLCTCRRVPCRFLFFLTLPLRRVCSPEFGSVLLWDVALCCLSPSFSHTLPLAVPQS